MSEVVVYLVAIVIFRVYVYVLHYVHVVVSVFRMSNSPKIFVQCVAHIDYIIYDMA